MTAISFIAGMIPLLIATGPGAEERRSIAVLVVGGMALSLLLTLLAVPVIYSILDDFGMLFRRKPAVAQQRGQFVRLPQCPERSRIFVGVSSGPKMLKQSLSILLAATIVTCPVVCRAGGACCANEQATHEKACCDACRHADRSSSAHHEREGGDQQSPAPNDACQCICGGAVFQLATLDLNLDAGEWVSTSVAEQFQAAISEPQFDAVNGAAIAGR